MTFQDTWAICTKCGTQFVFRVEDQRRQAERGEQITPPELCPSCRRSGRPSRRSEPRRESRPRPAAGREPKTTQMIGPGPYEGSVKWYDREKGYGFVVHPTGEELFFHRSGIAPGERPDFPDGTRVTYCVEQTEKGPQAADVARMDGEDST
jgi:CspA family cold shock protein